MRWSATGICAVVLFACAGYCAWAWHRSDLWFIGHDPAWPHAFPYPDVCVRDLEAYWDRARPAPPGTIKMHGEFQRVQVAVGLASIACTGAGILFSVPTLLRASRRVVGPRKGFPVIERDSGRQA
jgi:hypothetical protein